MTAFLAQHWPGGLVGVLDFCFVVCVLLLADLFGRYVKGGRRRR